MNNYIIYRQGRSQWVCKGHSSTLHGEKNICRGVRN